MRKLIGILTVLVLVGGMAFAQSLDGKKIVVTGGETAALNVPVSVPYDGPAPDKAIQVVGPHKKAYPAMIVDKNLIFVMNSVPAKESVKCEVKVLKEAAAPKVDIKKKGDAPELEVVVNGEPFTTYHYSNDNKKPFLWPVYGEGKVRVTRDWPMDPNALGSKDHPHHKSIWTAYGDVNGVDCWDEGPKSGFQHSDDVTFGAGDAYGWIKAKDTWQDAEHKPIIAEDREYRFYDTPAGARTFDAAITFTAKYGDVKFGDTKEGGIMAFRIRPDIQGNRGGVLMNASGATGEPACWGKPSPWTDYAGKIKGAGVRGIAVFDNPGNLRYPCSWHIRGYGLNGASVFGLGSFTKGKEKGEYTLENGKSLTFNYRVIIHSGTAQEAKLADRFAAYAKPLKAEFAK